MKYFIICLCLIFIGCSKINKNDFEVANFVCQDNGGLSNIELHGSILFYNCENGKYFKKEDAIEKYIQKKIKNQINPVKPTAPTPREYKVDFIPVTP